MSDGGRRARRTSRFFRVLLVLTALMHLFFGVAVYDALARLAIPAAPAWGLAAALAGIGVFFDRARLVMPDRKRSALGVRFVDVPFYIHFCAAFFTFLPALAATVLVPLGTMLVTGRAHYPSGFVLGTYLVGLALAAYGVLVRRRWFVVERIEVPVRGLDPKLDGFRIVQLSDLHIGSLTPRAWADRWVDAANAERPDLAVVTGDLVTSGVEFHDDIAAALARLDSPLGTVVSMGNHDYFGEGEPLVSRLREKCVVLRNEGRVYEKEGGRFFLAAVDDTWTRRADLERALSERPPAMPVVLLAHEPGMFDAAAAHDVALTLSGHTHGGQVAVPFLARRASLSHLGRHPYHLGVYEKDGARLYVHPGLGTTGPPIRLGVAPTVTVLTLRAG